MTRLALIAIRCVRFCCILSAGACGQRYLGSQERYPLVALRGCRGCSTGERNAALAQRRAPRNPKASYRALKRVSPSPRDRTTPFYEERTR